MFFESSDDARKARIHDSWVTVQYPHARLFTGTTYPVKVHRVRISAVVDEMTNTVTESKKKKIEEENRGLEITEIRWLSKPDETKRYGSMLLRLADEQTAVSLLEKGLLDVAGEICIVEEWEIQKLRGEGALNVKSLVILPYHVQVQVYVETARKKGTAIESVKIPGYYAQTVKENIEQIIEIVPLNQMCIYAQQLFWIKTPRIRLNFPKIILSAFNFR